MKNLIKKIVLRLFGSKKFNKINGFYSKLSANLNRKNLSRLAEIYGSDKFGHHFYTPHYMSYFASIRKKKLVLLEIGIGGYDDKEKGGESLLMWKKYFPNSMIYGIDIYDKSNLDSKRIKTFIGSQIDKDFLNKVIETIGYPDIIIDDGSHHPNHQIESFKILFPFLMTGGYYIVEDTSTSYSTEWGGSEDIYNKQTFLNFAKNITDHVNFQEFKHLFQRDCNYSIQEIDMISFYKDLIIIKK